MKVKFYRIFNGVDFNELPQKDFFEEIEIEKFKLEELTDTFGSLEKEFNSQFLFTPFINNLVNNPQSNVLNALKSKKSDNDLISLFTVLMSNNAFLHWAKNRIDNYFETNKRSLESVRSALIDRCKDILIVTRNKIEKTDESIRNAKETLETATALKESLEQKKDYIEKLKKLFESEVVG